LKVISLNENANHDKQLITRIISGETDLFGQLVDRYQDRVAGVCFNMMKEHNLANEVGQETFVRLYKSLEKFNFQSSLGTYITRIAINLCLNKLDSIQRRTNRFVGQNDKHHNIAGHGNSFQKDLESKEIVALGLDSLNPEARSVVVLRMIEGYSTKETSELLGIAEGTVMSKLSRALKKMKETLLKNGIAYG
jgi:RNA polymerase sigma-70 factor (ECF subfamily)